LVIAISTTTLSIGTLNGHAQNATTTPQAPQNQTANPQQIKGYLNQAIQALDSGNNTKALEQVDLAGGQLESMVGTEVGEDDDDEDEDEEEGPGEDADEPGDVDTNDQEDTP
jgi:hypothetical protein